MLLINRVFNTCLKFRVLILMCFIFQFGNAQKLIDYLDVANKNFTQQLSDSSILQNNPTTQIDFGYFIEPQYTISGSQRVYVSVMQEIPWIGKSAAYNLSLIHI